MKKSRKKSIKKTAKRSKRKSSAGKSVETCIRSITRSKLAKLPTKKLENASSKLRDRFSDTEVLLSQR